MFFIFSAYWYLMSSLRHSLPGPNTANKVQSRVQNSFWALLQAGMKAQLEGNIHMKSILGSYFLHNFCISSSYFVCFAELGFPFLEILADSEMEIRIP